MQTNHYNLVNIDNLQVARVIFWRIAVSSRYCTMRSLYHCAIKYVRLNNNKIEETMFAMPCFFQYEMKLFSEPREFVFGEYG